MWTNYDGSWRYNNNKGRILSIIRYNQRKGGFEVVDPVFDEVIGLYLDLDSAKEAAEYLWE